MKHSVGGVAVGMIIAITACVAATAADAPSGAQYELALNKAQANLGKAQWRYLHALRERTRAIDRQASHRATPGELSDAIATAERAAAALAAATAAVRQAQQDWSSTTVVANGR